MALNNIGLFHLDNNRITILGTDEEPWFVANEIGEIFGMKNIHYNLSSIPEGWKKALRIPYALGGTQKTTIINELAVYRIAMRSNKPNAIEFQNRVAEILKELRLKGKYELQRRNDVLQERLIESQMAIEDRENTIQELEEKISNLQYIEEKHEDLPISIVSRIIYLGFISQQNVDKVLKDGSVEVDGRYCNVEHPDKRKFISNLSSISRRLSLEKKNRLGLMPTISKKYRRNVYYRNDYVLYGDDIIRNFFYEKPFEYWNVDIDWEKPEENILQVIQ